ERSRRGAGAHRSAVQRRARDEDEHAPGHLQGAERPHRRPARGAREDDRRARGALRKASPISRVESERELVEHAQAGDTGAFDALVSLYSKRVLSIAWGIVRNAIDGEELAQEAFVKAHQEYDHFRSVDVVGSCVCDITTN